MRLARTREEVEAALRLRFEVFNLELHEGLAESFFTGLDEDEFDRFCDHLIVIDETTENVVGTCRMQTGEVAARSNRGFYGAQEFDFTPYEPIRDSLIELGRACIHKDRRSFTVMSLLSKGIIDYSLEHHGRYVIGCSSLTSQDPAGLPVVIFPEGTSSDGSSVLPFRSSLLESAIVAGVPITPIAIGYKMKQGSVADEICYWCDMVFGSHFWNLLGNRSITASLRFGRPHATIQGRKEHARSLRLAVIQLHNGQDLVDVSLER